MAIQHRRGTAAAATAANIVLAAGQLGVETDTGQFKVGDGTTAWSLLRYGGANALGVLLRASGDVYQTVLPGYGTKVVYVVNQEMAYPVSIGQGGIQVTGLQVNVQTGLAASTIRLGVRADNAGKPGTLILDAASVSAATAGFKTATVAWTPNTGTRYWLTATAQGSATGPTVLSVGNTNDNFALAWVGAASDPGGSTQAVTCYVDSTTGTGALPSAFTISGSQAGIDWGMCHIWLRT